MKRKNRPMSELNEFFLSSPSVLNCFHEVNAKRNILCCVVSHSGKSAASERMCMDVLGHFIHGFTSNRRKDA